MRVSQYQTKIISCNVNCLKYCMIFQFCFTVNMFIFAEGKIHKIYGSCYLHGGNFQCYSCIDVILHGGNLSNLTIIAKKT